MDLLGEEPVFNLEDPSWKIRSRTATEPPQYIGNTAVIQNSIITEGCEIEGTVINSLISSSVRIEKGAVVKDSVIMSGTLIKEGASVTYSIVDENAVIGKNSVVGADKSTTKNVTVVSAGTVLEDGMSMIPEKTSKKQK